MKIEASGSTGGGGSSFDAEGWIAAFCYVAQHYGLSMSVQGLRLSSAFSTSDRPQTRITELARGAGLRVRFIDPATSHVTSWQLPVIVELRNGQVAVVVALSDDEQAGVVFSDVDDLQPVPAEKIFSQARAIIVARPRRSIADARVDSYIKPYEENWLRRLILSARGSYFHVMIASLVANVLGLTGILFSMQVYDRVVPAQSYPTLYVLFGGMMLAIFFDFVMRKTRSGVIDIIGKHIDLRLSDRIMGHALRVKNRVRPQSTGSFIAQIRDIEQVREMLTSTTITALADLPFFFLFLGVFWYIAGQLALIPLAALAVMLLPGILAQGRLRRYAQSAMREGSLRNAMLVEAIQGIEDIKTLQAEDRFQQQWNHLNQVTGEAQLKLRALTSGLNAWTHCVQLGVYACVIFFGVPYVIEGTMTTGALVAASILSSRMIAPMAQVAQLTSRIQHARVGAKSLDQIMRMPIDHPPSETRVHCDAIAGAYELKSAVFRYGDESSPPALSVRSLRIRPGEKIAVLGKNGAGKSTLLQALSGMLEASAGEVLLENLAMQHIDPADVRRDVGLLTQDARLFHGTLRDNILMGAPRATQEQMLEALAMVGAHEFIRKLPKGLDHMILEGGLGLSGGQKQAILLARLLVRQPRVVLLDEPTAAMDEATERHFIREFGEWARDRTVVIATHRMRALELVDRIIVIENGLVALDDERERALLVLRGMSQQGGKKGRADGASKINHESGVEV
ncbi:MULTISPECIES: type I secretion system permease/ATPase [unclassified Aminobacter]|uniref:type I secretion system permease/ATPase n=1 Tax=unclassified Aminobacter TaxID=2644704 RepID=UPI000465772D|nr:MULTISPECIES: type I secretion system permease/ATPase [unclassified Aminobacter]TWH31319.1 ATP-binding cassette subfamily C protein LapB [Aminobacter sp. J15]